jgi:hypothetical protein
MEPAKVVHWDTIANVSEFLAPFTANFAQNCMSFRHLRFFRSVKDTKVWLQGTTRMNSWGDSTDEWRGLANQSTHTLCFNTSYGVPDLCSGVANDAFPNAQRRDVNPLEIVKWVEGMHTLRTLHANFNDDNLADCLEMLAGYTNPPKPFDWDIDDMALLYGAGAGATASVEVGDQISSGLPVGKVGDFFLCRPDGTDVDTFILGIIRGITRGMWDGRMTQGVNMQWFTHALDVQFDKYGGSYTAFLPSTTRYLT